MVDPSDLLGRAPGLRKQFTATGYVTDPGRTRMLMIHHRKLGRWMPPGGHVDVDEFPCDAAVRETLEETGVRASHVGSHRLSLDLDGLTAPRVRRHRA